jgi:hypothetical protein
VLTLLGDQDAREEFRQNHLVARLALLPPRERRQRLGARMRQDPIGLIRPQQAAATRQVCDPRQLVGHR